MNTNILAPRRVRRNLDSSPQPTNSATKATRASTIPRSVGRRACGSCGVGIDELPAGEAVCVRCRGFAELAQLLPRVCCAINPAPGCESPNFERLDPRIRKRLEAEGVRSINDWRRLGPRRRELFGIVPSVVRQIDELARGTP
jgi:hypothetical protein